MRFNNYDNPSINSIRQYFRKIILSSGCRWIPGCSM